MAAAERLPWIASLGVNVVYLSPVTLADDDMDKRYWSPRQIRSGTAEPRNPYRVKDYYAPGNGAGMRRPAVAMPWWNSRPLFTAHKQTVAVAWMHSVASPVSPLRPEGMSMARMGCREALA